MVASRGSMPVNMFLCKSLPADQKVHIDHKVSTFINSLHFVFQVLHVLLSEGTAEHIFTRDHPPHTLHTDRSHRLIAQEQRTPHSHPPHHA